VEDHYAQGIKKAETLRSLGVSRSTYYGWLKRTPKASAFNSILALTEVEARAVLEKKQAEPHLSHRRISGVLRQEGYSISPSNCYHMLKERGWVWPQPLR